VLSGSLFLKEPLVRGRFFKQVIEPSNKVLFRFWKMEKPPGKVDVAFQKQSGS
jgi:hypothetical protein